MNYVIILNPSLMVIYQEKYFFEMEMYAYCIFIKRFQ